MPGDKTKNDAADEFFSDELDLEHVSETETRAERAGRQYAEEKQRYATMGAVSRLAAAVAETAKAQAETASSLVLLSSRIGTMEDSFKKMTLWMEGDIDPSGTRIPGFIDQIGSWRRWKTQITVGIATTATGIIGLLCVAIVRLIIDLSAATVGVHIKQ